MSFFKCDTLEKARTDSTRASVKGDYPHCGFVDNFGESLNHRDMLMAPQLWFNISKSELDSNGKVAQETLDDAGAVVLDSECPEAADYDHINRGTY